MRFIILGAGALGSILGVHLQRAGHEVQVIARGRRAAHLQQHGITLKGLAEHRERCSVVTDPSRLHATDVLVVTTKTYDHAAAVGQVRHLELDCAFSVANGVVKDEQLEAAFGTAHTLGCMADFSGELLGSGDVLFTRNGGLHLGALASAHQDKAVAVTKTIDAAGIVCRAVPDIRSVEWSKFVGWVAFLSASVVTRAETWKFMVDRDAAAIIYRVIQEMAQLAAHLGIEVTDQSPIPAARIGASTEEAGIAELQELGRKFHGTVPAHKMSSLQDLENGRRLEVRETLGDALARGADAGIPMPTLSLCYHLVSAIDRINTGSHCGSRSRQVAYRRQVRVSRQPRKVFAAHTVLCR